MKVVIDIETIPDQSENAIENIAKDLVVKAPDMLKPQLIQVLNLDAKIKSTVPELKSMWLEKFGEQAKLDQAKEQWLKTSFDGAKGNICCICVSVDGGVIHKFYGGEEQSLLNDFNDYIETFARPSQLLKPYFIGHNSIKFDLPFLHKRMIINKIKPSFELIAHGRHGVNCFDNMIEWAGYGNRISMDNLASALSVKGKTEGMDGSQVWPEYEKGNIQKIADYCADDVECTYDIYKRLTFS